MSIVFVHTRPSERQANTAYAALCHALDEMGVKNHALPLLSLCAITTDDTPKKLTKLKNGEYALLVVVSITAVEFALKALSQNDLDHINAQIQNGKLHVIAVGNATAQALANIGIIAQTPITMNNEGMLQLPIVQDLLQKKGKVLFWRGVGGRTLLADTLTAHGVVVESICWYQRLRPLDLDEQAIALKNKLLPNDVLAVLISSEQAWQNWQSLKITHAGYFLCLGERLYHLVRACCHDVVLLDDLSKKAITHAVADIQSAIADKRQTSQK